MPPPASHNKQSTRSKALLALNATCLLVLAVWLGVTCTDSGRRASTRLTLASPLAPPPAPPAWVGAQWTFPISPSQLDRGIIYEGDAEAAGRLARKLLAGATISAVALGGSLTMGRGASAFGRTDWVALVGAWLRGAFPGANHSMLNSAIPASPSEYISFCLQRYLPPQPDLVLVEYNVNNMQHAWEHPNPRSLERLLRRLLGLPSRPLVVGVMLQSFNEFHSNGTFYLTGEDSQGTLLQYYMLPWLSMRSVVFREMQQGAEGFKPRQWLQQDRIHPNDRGNEYIAQLVVRYLQRILQLEQQRQQQAQEHQQQGGSWRQAASGPSQQEQQQESLAQQQIAQQHRKSEAPGVGLSEAAAAAPTSGPAQLLLPPPMLPGAVGIAAEVCLHNERFKAAVVPGSMRGFQWEDLGMKGHPEDRMFTWAVGAQATVKVNTDVRPQGAEAPPADATHVAVFLWITRSHQYMGDGAATCSGGCKCAPQLLKTLTKTGFGTQEHLHLLMVTRAADCRITVRTLRSTDSGKHYFRFRGLVVSSVAAAPGAVPEFATAGPKLSKPASGWPAAKAAG